MNVDAPDTLPQLERIAPGTITLEKGNAPACAELDFGAPLRSAISGEVTDEAGRPLSGVFVQLRFAEQLDYSRGTQGGGVRTGADGRYRIEGFPPGRYLVGVALNGPSPGNPFAESYARTMDGTMVFALGSGERITLPPIRTRRMTSVVVSGIVRERGGDPARGMNLAATMLREDGRAYLPNNVKTDVDGKFQLRLWEGQRYRILIGARFNPDAEVEFVARDASLTITTR